MVGSTLNARRAGTTHASIADAIINIGYHRSGTRLVRTINVEKMRGSPHSDDLFRLEIRQGGLGVEPL